MKRIILGMLLAFAGLAASAQNNDYGRNIIRFYPINAFVYGGVGAGIGYERIVTNDGKVGINIPVQFGVSPNYDNYGSSNYSQYNNFSTLIKPGIKFYPMGQRKVTYAIGVSVFTVFGDRDYYSSYYDNFGNWITRRMHGSYSKAGMSIDNYLQFNISKKFNFGMDVGIGPSYLNQFKDNTGTTNEGLNVMANFGFHLGYRF